MTSYIALSYWDLALASVLVLIDAGLSILFGLKIHRSLLVAATRMAAQLTLVCWHPCAGYSSPSPVASLDRRQPVHGLTPRVLAAAHPRPACRKPVIARARYAVANPGADRSR